MAFIPVSPTVLKALAALTTTTLAMLTGGALHMYLFSIPVITAGALTNPNPNPKPNTTANTANTTNTPTPPPSTTALTLLHQFHHLTDLGAKYMQTTARASTASLLLLALLSHPSLQTPNPLQSWPYFALAAFVLAQTAWWEIAFVFPINARLIALERREEVLVGEGVAGVGLGEVLVRLEDWRRWHVGRIAFPAVAAGLAFVGCFGL
ncbi:hypothetical protein MBLNU230_g0745t1 [Neophaeotheca triangularis]